MLHTFHRVTGLKTVCYLKLMQFNSTILSLLPVRWRYTPGSTSRRSVISLEIYLTCAFSCVTRVHEKLRSLGISRDHIEIVTILK